jgi:hypothetical protein
VPPLLSICSLTSLMHDTVLISAFTPLTSSCSESSSHLLVLRTGESRNALNQDGFFPMSQRETTEWRDQRFLSIRAFQTCLEACPWTLWGVGDGSIPRDHRHDGTVICGRERVQEGWLRGSWNSMEPGHLVREQRVLSQAPIVVVRGLHDGRIRAGNQRVSAQRCSSLLRACSFLFDHVDGDTQDDGGIESAISISARVSLQERTCRSEPGKRAACVWACVITVFSDDHSSVSVCCRTIPRSCVICSASSRGPRNPKRTSSADRTSLRRREVGSCGSPRWKVLSLSSQSVRLAILLLSSCSAEPFLETAVGRVFLAHLSSQ